jgi:ABC-type multidrug transport system fused ATPase/permease subunit
MLCDRYGSELITDGIINFKQLMTAILSLMLGALGLGQALNRLMDQGEALEAARRIFNALDEADEDPIDGMSGAGKVPEKASVGRIELKGVSFRYPTRPLAKVCKDYSLVVEPGELVALVGPSGSGKSTIINLLLRFYDPNSGVVSLDGVDIRDLNVRWLRSQIGYVGQEPVLFSGSIAENIAYGRQEEREHKSKSLEELMSQKPFIDTVMQDKSIANCCRCCNTKTEGERESATRKCASTLYESLLNGPASPDRDPKGRSSESRDSQGSASGSRRSGSFGISMKDFDEERDSKGKNEGADPDIVDAAKASSAHDFISSFAEGYETDVGENSVMVSGGQKQRIAIARALIKKPAVLLLDEATSALDAVNEKLVQASIDKLQQSKQQTTIVIAHRLTTIRGADKIVVVDKGMVIESGTHDELLSLGGLYRELWEKQTGGRAPLNEMKSMKMQY